MNTRWQAHKQHSAFSIQNVVTRSASERDRSPNIWDKFLAFLNQSFSESNLKIRQVSDQGGRVWWYAYEPMTGQMTYLESEMDVQMWLEERFRQ